MRSCVKRVRDYYGSHFWCGLVTIVLGAAVCLMVITRMYLNKEYTNYLSERTYEAEYNILQLSQSNLQTMLDEMISLGSLAATDDDLYRVAGEMSVGNSSAVTKNEADTLLRSYAYMSQWIQGVSIADSEELLRQYWRNRDFNWEEDQASMVFDAVQNIIEKRASQNIPSYEYVGTTVEEDGPVLLHLAFPIVGSSGSNVCESVIVLSLSEDFLEDVLGMEAEKDQNPLAYGFLVDKEGLIVYHADAARIGGFSEEYVETEELECLSLSLNRLGWTLCIGIDEAEMRANIDALYRSGIILYGIVLACIFALLFVMVTKLIQPVHRISRNIEYVKQGDYNEQIEIQGKNEIWKLADEFNSMTRSIRRMREEIEEEHRSHLQTMQKMQEAERGALESQINAHFVCNTIGAINYEAMEAGNYRVSEMLKKLSNILRYTFDQRHQRVYMEQEIAWLEQYLYLQKVRYEDVFEYVIQMPEEVNEWPCCKLIFQPFVENSILHGFEGMEQGGCIVIQGSLLGENLLQVEIRDNGKGMPESICQAIRQTLCGEGRDASLGIGITNVASRLRYYYGERAVLSLESGEGKGTLVRLIIPRKMRQDSM